MNLPFQAGQSDLKGPEIHKINLGIINVYSAWKKDCENVQASDKANSYLEAKGLS